MNDSNTSKNHIVVFARHMSLVGTRTWAKHRELFISKRESKKAWRDHCLALESGLLPQNDAQLLITHRIARFLWMAFRLDHGLQSKLDRMLDQGKAMDTIVELTERQERTLNSLDKAIIRNIDLLRRMQGLDSRQRIAEARSDREK